VGEQTYQLATTDTGVTMRYKIPKYKILTAFCNNIQNNWVMRA